MNLQDLFLCILSSRVEIVTERRLLRLLLLLLLLLLLHTSFKWNVRDVSMETNRSFVKEEVEEKENVSSMPLT